MADTTSGATETYEFNVYTSSGWDKRTYTYTHLTGNLADSAAASVTTTLSSAVAFKQARDRAWSLDLKSHRGAAPTTTSPAT